MMTNWTPELEAYVEGHVSPMDELLLSLYRETYLHTMNPRMASGPVQGRFLQMICEMTKPSRVLEIGTFTGFSTICMARGMAKDSQLITIEANEELEEMIRNYLALAEVDDRVRLIIGDAKEVIPALEGPFDLVYIDADKLHYPLYYDLVIEKVAQGGLILADNVLWDGKVVDPRAKGADTQAIREFNDKVMGDPRVEQVLLPLRDGLMMARKL